MFYPYKNRILNQNLPVRVYKNLHNNMLSIVQEGKVVGHATAVCLKNVSYKISEAGRQRVIREKAKNVHAFVVGEVFNFTETPNAKGRAVSYNPYRFGHFYNKDDMTPSKPKPHEALYIDFTKMLVL